MANTIQLKRGTAASVSGATLAAGEPAVDLTNGKLYVGNGTDKVLVNPDNVPSASKLLTARTITMSNEISGAVTFDGSADVTFAATLVPSGVTAGTYPKVTVNNEGRVTVGASLAASDIPALTLSKISNAGTAAAANTGTAAGNVPVLDANGYLPVGAVPVAIGKTLQINSVTLQSGEPAGDQSAAPKAYVDTKTASAQMAATAYADGLLAANDAMVFKGTLGTGGTAAALPTSGYSAGWTYRIITAGTWAGQTCEVGDLAICVKDYASAYADSDWTVVQTNETDVAHLTSPTFAGTPAAPTATAATNTTQLATTAFVHSAIGADRAYEGTASNIKMNGTQAVGSLATVARGDHVHPTDTTRAPLASPALTGTPTAPTASTGTNTTQLATTAFVQAQIAATVASSLIDGGVF